MGGLEVSFTKIFMITLGMISRDSKQPSSQDALIDNLGGIARKLLDKFVQCRLCCHWCYDAPHTPNEIQIVGPV